MWIISASGWLFKTKSITMHGNMNVKNFLKFKIRAKVAKKKLIYPLCYEIRCDLKHVYEILHKRLSNIRNDKYV